MAGFHRNGAVQAESPDMFLFVNPGSGGGVGKFFLEDGIPSVIPLEDGRTKKLRVFSLPDGKPGDKPGFHALRESAAQGLVRVIVGGGDGSVMWVAGEAEKHGIDCAKQIALGIIPLGTGNDFSRHLGYGGYNPKPSKLRRNGYAKVITLFQQYATARPEPFDVWKAMLRTHPVAGRVFTHNKQGGEDVEVGGVIERLWILYFSSGDDGMSGYAFEPNRVESQLGNLVQYTSALLSTYLEEKCSGDSLLNKIRSVHAGLDENAPLVFHTSEDMEGAELTHNPGIFLMLNVDSYGGGSARPWRNSSPSLGVDEPLDEDIKSREASAYDNKFEVMSIRSLLRVGASAAPTVGARRIAQLPAVHVTFWPPEEGGDDVEEYFQMDGEFYRVLNPSSMTVKHHQMLKVLHKRDPVRDDEYDSELSDAEPE